MAYRRTPEVMERLAAKHGKILDAAIFLIARSGMENFEMDLVAERADVAIGTVYRYFKDYNTLMTAIIERVAEQHVTSMEVGLKKGLPGALRGLVDALKHRPRLTAAMFEQPAYVALLTAALRKHVDSRMVVTAMLGSMRACIEAYPKDDCGTLVALLMCLVAPLRVKVPA